MPSMIPFCVCGHRFAYHVPASNAEPCSVGWDAGNFYAPPHGCPCPNYTPEETE